MENYVGHIVFVERANPNKNYGNYYNGEYIIFRQSPNNLYGYSTKNPRAHNAGDERILEITGEGAYTIIAAKRDDDFVRRYAEDLLAFANSSDEKKWVDSVYTSARRAGEVIQSLLPSTTTGTERDVLVSQVGQAHADRILRAFDVKLKETPRQRAVRRAKLNLSLSLGASALYMGREDVEELIK
jgi:hypothetical protein